MKKLKATVNPSDGDNKSVLWESSNKNIITVDSSGNVKAISPGKATVTVKTVDGGKVAKCEVTVTNPITQGWIEEGGKKYYYNNGVKYTGLQYVDGSRYYFGTDGAMRTGWQILENIYITLDWMDKLLKMSGLLKMEKHID